MKTFIVKILTLNFIFEIKLHKTVQMNTEQFHKTFEFCFCVVSFFLYTISIYFVIKHRNWNQ